MLGLILCGGIYFSDGYLAITLIALLGLANALMWPAIFPLAIDGLGKHTQVGSALLIMGIAGGALIPLLYGFLKDSLKLPNNLSFFMVSFPAYVYILYYALAGHKAGRASLATLPQS